MVWALRLIISLSHGAIRCVSMMTWCYSYEGITLKTKERKMMRNKKMPEYEGGCLCGETTFTARGENLATHICARVRCVKSPLVRQPLPGLSFL
jgi:hypothetical protein